MKNEGIAKLLLPGVIVGAILGFTLGMIAGVNAENPIPNYIGGILCCLIPTLLNCLIVVKGAAKNLKREITVPEILKRIAFYLICAGLIGLFVYVVVMEGILEIDSRLLSRGGNACLQSVMGVLVSTLFGYIAIKTYAEDVKYTKRKSTKKSAKK